MDNVVSFTDMFTAIIDLFQLMYNAGIALFDFFSSPLMETIGNEGELAEWLEAVLPYTPFELMFGFGLMTVLATLFIKVFVPIL